MLVCLTKTWPNSLKYNTGHAFSRKDHFASPMPKRHGSLATLLLHSPTLQLQLRLTSCICRTRKKQQCCRNAYGLHKPLPKTAAFTACGTVCRCWDRDNCIFSIIFPLFGCCVFLICKLLEKTNVD